MPQVQVVDTTENKPDPTGVQEFFSKLGKSYKDQKDQMEIGKLIDQYKTNRQDANAWEDLQLNLEKSNISPSKRLQTQKTLNETRKLVIDKDKALNAQMTTHATQFEKTLQTEEAKKLVKLEEDIPKAKDALANLDRIEYLAENELSGPKGYAKALFNTESARELETLSFSSIEPILKLFNPVGPIPVQKVKIIQQQYQVHPSDTQSSMKGKIATLRRLGKQGLARAEERAALIRKYQGNIPDEVIKDFDKESEKLLDVILDKESFDTKIKDAKDDELIEGLYSTKDGRKLKGIPKQEAKKLYDEGVVTNVPPQ